MQHTIAIAYSRAATAHTYTVMMAHSQSTNTVVSPSFHLRLRVQAWDGCTCDADSGVRVCMRANDVYVNGVDALTYNSQTLHTEMQQIFLWGK